jgi:hypothetical protein
MIKKKCSLEESKIEGPSIHFLGQSTPSRGRPPLLLIQSHFFRHLAGGGESGTARVLWYCIRSTPPGYHRSKGCPLGPFGKGKVSRSIPPKAIEQKQNLFFGFGRWVFFLLFLFLPLFSLFISLGALHFFCSCVASTPPRLDKLRGSVLQILLLLLHLHSVMGPVEVFS